MATMSDQTGKGTLLVVTGPSGAGKGTVLGRVLPAFDRLHYSISATTRKPRPGETDGKSYYFLTHEQFRAMIDGDELLEYAEYVGNYYGTPAAPVERELAAGNDVVLEIEVQGALMVKKKRPDAVLVFIIPPEFSLLEQRLRGRGSEPDDVIARRLEKARSEYKCGDRYDYIVINDDLEQAVKELSSILIAQRCKTEKRIELLR